MHIWSLILGVFLAGLGFWNIGDAIRDWPRKTNWDFLPNGHYETTSFPDGTISIKDVYGRIVATGKIKAEINEGEA